MHHVEIHGPGLGGLHLQLDVVHVPLPELQDQILRGGPQQTVSCRDHPGGPDDRPPALVYVAQPIKLSD